MERGRGTPSDRPRLRIGSLIAVEHSWRRTPRCSPTWSHRPDRFRSSTRGPSKPTVFDRNEAGRRFFQERRHEAHSGIHRAFAHSSVTWPDHGRRPSDLSLPEAALDPFLDRVILRLVAQQLEQALDRYNATLQKLIELRKINKNCGDSREMERAWNLWESRLDRLVRIVPTSWAGVSALVHVSLDPNSVGPAEDLLREAMRTIGKALQKLIPQGPHCAA